MEASTTARPTGADTGEKNVGRIEEIQGVVIEAVFPDELPEINNAIRVKLPEAAKADEGASARPARVARLRGAAAPRRRPRPRGRDGHHRRPGPRPGGRRHRRPDHGAGRRDDARPHLQPARRRHRRGRAARGQGALADPPRRPDGREPDADDRDVRDRHQGRRPARALRQGRQGRPVRRRRRRQDGAHPGAHPQPRHRSTAACRPSAAWASARARATTSGWR